ncbi:23S rRNA (pseudouridine(1915)-N(3))-methyltransferase RlmH [Acidocella facilis]|uniref:23S rRNA (pseudouridine(1915)-N(3))-methyltransferase RlmH n=1 Tax=Acidocella facilis TaxID=525 RepID=UPI001F380A8D|nr:23S rRNA (pseudouridine(1915)-N(3))-methyltransferase RlmH [Acidocella facilis]
MRLLAIGKAPSKAPEMELFARYAKRIRPAMGLVEFADGQGAPAEIKRREGDAILAALKPDEFLIALDMGGAAPDSPGLAKLLAGWLERSKKLTFVIGGAEGLDAPVIARAGAKLSLGTLTWPHMLVRPMLAEQIYRAQSILAGHPYHRAGRP